MAVSKTSEYALRAVAWLASNGDEPKTTQQIADATHIPPSYLPKVLQPLVRAGFVSGQRGVRGGYSLSCDPARLRLLEVVECIAPVAHPPGGGDDHASAPCKLSVLLSELEEQCRQRLAGLSVASLVERAPQACGGPGV